MSAPSIIMDIVSVHRFWPPVGSAQPEPWLSAPTAAVIVGLVGCALGVLAALLARMAVRGRSNRTVPGIAATVCAVGTGCVAAGAAAVVSGQPGFVFYPLCVLGGLVILMAVIVLVLARRVWTARDRARAPASEG